MFTISQSSQFFFQSVIRNVDFCQSSRGLSLDIGSYFKSDPLSGLENETHTEITTSECKIIEKLLQIRSSQKSKPVFSLRNFTKSSHPSGGVTPPGRSAYFPGSKLFSDTCQKMRVTAHNTGMCRLWEKSTSYSGLCTYRRYRYYYYRMCIPGTPTCMDLALPLPMGLR